MICTGAEFVQHAWITCHFFLIVRTKQTTIPLLWSCVQFELLVNFTFWSGNHFGLFAFDLSRPFGVIWCTPYNTTKHSLCKLRCRTTMFTAWSSLWSAFFSLVALSLHTTSFRKTIRLKHMEVHVLMTQLWNNMLPVILFISKTPMKPHNDTFILFSIVIHVPLCLPRHLCSRSFKIKNTSTLQDLSCWCNTCLFYETSKTVVMLKLTASRCRIKWTVVNKNVTRLNWLH